MELRRRTDKHLTTERRGTVRDRRIGPPPATMRFPSRSEQALQFLTRYLFAILGMVFFNYSDDFVARGMTLPQLNAVFGVYLLFNSLTFIHAWMRPISPARYRVALWVDILMVSLCVMNDPNEIPPSFVAYIVVVLGNGMRYGMRFFAEAMAGALVGGAMVMFLRYVWFGYTLTPGTVFLSLFGLLIIVYAYILMGRVERSRHRSEHVSRTDPLTGLLNRRGLAEAATGWLANSRQSERRLVVMFADLDRFKTVNDRHGHAEGDRVLIKVADLLVDSTRSADLVARYGGDEFVLLLIDTDLSVAQSIAHRIQTVVEEWMRDNEFVCGISIGVSEAPPGDLNLTDVLNSVDRLLYDAKHRRNGERPLGDVITE